MAQGRVYSEVSPKVLLKEIEGFMRKHSMSASAFGVTACGDPRLVFDMRTGRKLFPSTVGKIRALLDGAVHPHVSSAPTTRMKEVSQDVIGDRYRSDCADIAQGSQSLLKAILSANPRGHIPFITAPRHRGESSSVL